MAIGIGGSTPELELRKLHTSAAPIMPINNLDREIRLAKARQLMQAQGIGALYLDAGVNLTYFTGLELNQTERLQGAILSADGQLIYVCPAFEEPKVRSKLHMGDEIRGWEEHENPAELVVATLASIGIPAGRLAIDPNAPFFKADGIRQAGTRFDLVNAASITGVCRSIKSEKEIALMQRANDITLAVHKATASILSTGISTVEVGQFTLEAHRLLGGETANASRPLVLFGEATAYPHGVDGPQYLKDGDMVLIDLSCVVGGYRSDMTRTYVFGDPSPRQREIWNLEKAAQAAGFAAAQIGGTCEAVDIAARGIIEVAPGFETDYRTPGLPHRTGHGIGMEVHEESYIVRGNKRPLEAGMCFSIEPTICIYGEFGIRLEDIVHMTEAGPRWFTTPSLSIDDPFGYRG